MATGNVQLAILWHFHQPCYRDLPTGRFLMPWVRLHGIKDYTGMAALLEEFPAIRSTANFSPVLLDQLQAYVDGAADTMLDATLVPAQELGDEQKAAIRSTFFWAHPENVIGTLPRYRQLYELQRAGAAFREQDFRDLQVLANLAWFHPLCRSVDDLRAKGRGYSEDDKATLVHRTRDVLAGVLRRWKGLGERAELSVSPYYHPIVPLLCDFASAREAIPDLPLPDAPGFRAEAEVQVSRALEAGERHFGRRPRGMWPSEGSVSEEACDLFHRAGVEWVATDEAICGAPGVRTRKGLKIAFRDTELSNLLGFTYKMMDPETAAADFVRRLESREGPVPVCLDGENPWEHYPGGAVPFLRALFRRLSDHPTIRTSTMSELGARGELDRVFAGSWINRSFGVWIGHPEDRRGWELLGRTYRDLLTDGSRDPIAWESLRAAEGSDWFWWFGDDFASSQDAEFDALFRRHLMNVYRRLGRAWPDELQKPVKQVRTAQVVRRPTAPLRVRLDGRRSGYFEWVSAGRYDMSREYGAIAGEAAFISDLWYGFDAERLWIRLDFRKGVRPVAALSGGELRVILAHPRAADARLEGAVDEIYEGAATFADLRLKPGEEAEFFVEFERPGQVPLRLPTLAPLAFRVPDSGLDLADWHV